MKDEQANNKLPEKTIQEKLKEYISEKFPFGENSYLIKRRAAEYVSGYASMLYEKELSSKDKLIELTNNNLLAALEEVKMLKEELQTLKSEYNELWDQAQSWREESGNLPRP